MRRRTLLTAAAGIAASPALGGLARPAIAQSAARVLRFSPAVALTSIDPLWSLATISYTHGYMVWDTLFAIDSNLNPHPQAADKAEVSDDQLTWTITLRDGLIFHDNEPVRARDAAASVKRWMQKDPIGQTIFAITNEVKTLDDKHFAIVLKQPFPTMRFSLASRNIFVQPERLANTPASEQFKEVIGSGPYRFIASDFQPGAISHYARWDKYVARSEPPDLWSGGHVANFDRVEWTAQPDKSIEAAALQRGEIDWAEQPLLDLVPMLSKTKGLKVEAVDPFGGLAILRFNHLIPPFNNVAMRQALLAAIDQKAVVEAVVGDQPQFGRVPVGFFTSGAPMANDAGLSVLTGPRNADETKQRLAAAGYKGERIVMVAPSDIPAIMTMSQVMQDQLHKMGLNIDFQVMDWGTMISRIAKKDPIDQGGWNLYCVTWAGLTVSNPGSSYPLRANGLQANTGWPTDPKLEALRNDWLATSDLDKQKAIAQ
ncbi:MAG TPA: ABC transporter substrate-binding protein, partial [Acetobacteraceae bacterium]|nr:ABC transporter substrate-binding protein [Acetobacteraceae bacterium]